MLRYVIRRRSVVTRTVLIRMCHMFPLFYFRKSQDPATKLVPGIVQIRTKNSEQPKHLLKYQI